MSKSVSFLYKLARKLNDVKFIISGDPKKIARRVKNKIVGRESIKKILTMRRNLPKEDKN